MKKFSLLNSGLGKKLGTKGVYITLTACLLAVGGAGIAAYNKAVSDINDSLTISRSESDSLPTKYERQADNKTPGVAIDDSSKIETDFSSTDDTSSKADIKTQPNVMPVNGEILNPFSNGELVKSLTLGVWKTHDGVDIKAEKGTEVKSMNKGKVTRVWEDALWGSCISIDHGNGIVGYYYNLAKQTNVSEGDTVDSGEVIGAVGDTAQVESAELSHLHFGLKKDGSWIDPIEFINPALNK